MKVKRSCGADNIIKPEGLTADEALRASWDYFERSSGIPNPEHRESSKIDPLKPQPKEL